MNTPDTELVAAWQARVASGQFSEGVLGVGTLRVMGKSGDAPLTWPRITSLGALDTLAEDEQWALRQAQAVVEQAERNARTVFDVAPTEGKTAPTGTRVTTFAPESESLIVLSRIAGG